jgi:hypothetical protein
MLVGRRVKTLSWGYVPRNSWTMDSGMTRAKTFSPCIHTVHARILTIAFDLSDDTNLFSMSLLVKFEAKSNLSRMA